MSEEELDALQKILDFIVPKFNIFGYSKKRFIKRLLNEASHSPSMTSLQLRMVYTELRRIYK